MIDPTMASIIRPIAMSACGRRNAANPAGTGCRCNKLRSRYRTGGGFTVLEVMLAAVVLAFAISTAITTLVQGLRTLDTARSVFIANQILQDEMENVRLASWTTVSGWTTGATTTLTLSTAFTGNATVGNRFACTRTVGAVSGKSSLRQITLTVSWTGSDGRSHERKTTTYYGQTGIYEYVSS